MSAPPRLLPSPSQTVGPYFSIGLSWLNCPDLVPADHPGAITITGRVLDADDAPVPDAVLELWQADQHGQFRTTPPDPADTAASFAGWGRSPTDNNGTFRFTTVVPGTVDAVQAPHADLSVFMRGLLQRLVTRIYFPPTVGVDDPSRWVPPSSDPVAGGVPADRIRTLVAQPSGGEYRFDVHLGGPAETVFFAW